MNLSRYTIPAWKVRAERALTWHCDDVNAMAYNGRTMQTAQYDIPRPAYLSDTPHEPASPTMRYWLAGGRNVLRKVIRYDFRTMTEALEACNDYARKFPEYTFGVGAITASHPKVSWGTAIYRYDPTTRRCMPM